MSNIARRAVGRLVGCVAVCVLWAGTHGVTAQQAPPRPPQIPQTAQARPAIDLTGNWVAVVTEDWRWRMVTPPKGDYTNVPLNPEGRKMADAWDHARDVAQGVQCRAFGVGNIMRMPGRLKISWQDPQTLKLEYDAGTQTRLLHFDKTRRPAAERTWQGWSVAEWEFAAEGPGSLKVVTTNMRGGYLRKNGVPYSENMVMTEHFDRHMEANGDEWFTVTTIVEEPRYLTQPFVTTTHFKKEPDASKWRPTPCAIDRPLK